MHAWRGRGTIQLCRALYEKVKCTAGFQIKRPTQSNFHHSPNLQISAAATFTSKQVSKMSLESCRRCSDLKISSKSSPDLWHPRERRVEPLSPTEWSLVDLLNCDRPSYNSSISYQQLTQQAPVQHIEELQARVKANALEDWPRPLNTKFAVVTFADKPHWWPPRPLE